MDTIPFNRERFKTELKGKRGPDFLKFAVLDGMGNNPKCRADILTITLAVLHEANAALHGKKDHLPADTNERFDNVEALIAALTNPRRRKLVVMPMAEKLRTMVMERCLDVFADEIHRDDEVRATAMS